MTAIITTRPRFIESQNLTSVKIERGETPPETSSRTADQFVSNGLADAGRPPIQTGLEGAFLTAQATETRPNDAKSNNEILLEYIHSVQAGILPIQKHQALLVYDARGGPLNKLIGDFAKFEKDLGENSLMQQLKKFSVPILTMPLSGKIADRLRVRGLNVPLTDNENKLRGYLLAVRVDDNLDESEKFAAFENELREIVSRQRGLPVTDGSYQAASYTLSRVLALVHGKPSTTLLERFATMLSDYNKVIKWYEDEHQDTVATEQSLQKAADVLTARLNAHGINKGSQGLDPALEIYFAVVDGRIKPRTRSRSNES